MDKTTFVRYRKGDPGYEFTSGSEFEYFVVGRNADSEKYLAHIQRVIPDTEQRGEFLSQSGFGASKLQNLERAKTDRPRIPFVTALKESIEQARTEGFDYPGLARNLTVLAPYLFREVAARLPKKRRGCLQMYCTAGTSFDFDYGADLVFILCKNLVRIDTTVNLTKPVTGDPNHLIMTNCDVDIRSMARFAARIAERLLDPESRSMYGPEAL